MTKDATPKVDLIRELRLRHWARLNYVPPEQRRETWHPVVLDEMHRRDVEMSRLSPEFAVGHGYVPLAPGEIRAIHGAHESYPDPKLLRHTRPSEVRSNTAGDLV